MPALSRDGVAALPSGLISDADYLAEVERTQQSHTEQSQKMIAQALTDAERIKLRKLLDSHEGKPQ